MNRTAIAIASTFAAAALGLLLSGSARAEPFHKLPADMIGKPSDLLVRIVSYAGSSNGVITIDVKNPSGQAQEFTAKGIYFVPRGDADQAPQRLGAVGPFKVLSANGARRERLTIAAGATE